MTSTQQDQQRESEDFSQFPCNDVDFVSILDEGSVVSFFDYFVLDDEMMSEAGSLNNAMIPNSCSDTTAKNIESLHNSSISMSSRHGRLANVGPAAELTDVFDNETNIRQSTYLQLQRLSDSMRRSEVTRQLIIEHRQSMFYKDYDPQLTAFCRSANSYMLAAASVTLCHERYSPNYRGNVARVAQKQSSLIIGGILQIKG
jgi:hypothetical protein